MNGHKTRFISLRAGSGLNRRPLMAVLSGAAVIALAVSLVNLHAPAKTNKKKMQELQTRVLQSVYDLTENYLRADPIPAPLPKDQQPQSLSPLRFASSIGLDFIAPLRFGLAPGADDVSKGAFDFGTGKPSDEDGAISKTIAVGRGDTIMKLLTSAGADPDESRSAVAELGKVFDLRKLRLGQEITLTFSHDDDDGLKLQAINLAPSFEKNVAVERKDSGAFTANQATVPLIPQAVRAGGVIESSLFGSAQSANIPPAIIGDMIRIFSYDVDFQREVQKGDRFEVMFERYYDDQGRLAREGNIIYASMTLSGQVLRYYRYQPSDDRTPDYFTEKGQSVRKALLRTPIDGAKLTSGFGMRVNPVLGYTAQHKGVDFGAQIGTPIAAAGDGVVDMVGWNGAYGKYVRIRHTNGYSTAYAHMSAFGADLRQGQRVNQGQTIGYVGTTGRSTGPHLHYEVLVNNNQVNPLSVRLPTGRKLEGKELERFLQQTSATLVDLQKIPYKNKLAQN